MAVTYGVTKDGFVRKPLAEIINSLNGRFIGAFGDTFDVSPASPDGQEIGIFANELDLMWQQVQGAFNAYRPGAVEGRALDAVVELNGIERYVDVPTKVTVTLAGTGGKTVPAGSKVRSDTGYTFSLEEDVILPAGGTAVCDELGAIEILPHQIKTIVTPVEGWLTVDNPERGVTGVVYESDPELRVRREKSTVNVGTNTVEAIYGSLAELDLQYVRIRNNTSTTAIGTQPGNSVQVVVIGGVQEEIARRIYDNMPGGVPTFGSVKVTIPDPKGYPQDVYFNRPVDVPTYISLEYEKLPTTNISSNDAELLIKEALKNYFSTLMPGSPVVWSYLFNPALSASPGLQINNLFLGTTASPTTTATVEIDINQIAVTDDVHIVVTEKVVP